MLSISQPTFTSRRAGPAGNLPNSKCSCLLRNKLTAVPVTPPTPPLFLLSVSLISEDVIDRPFFSQAKQRYIFLNSAVSKGNTTNCSTSNCSATLWSQDPVKVPRYVTDLSTQFLMCSATWFWSVSRRRNRCFGDVLRVIIGCHTVLRIMYDYVLVWSCSEP